MNNTIKQALEAMRMYVEHFGDPLQCLKPAIAALSASDAPQAEQPEPVGKVVYYVGGLMRDHEWIQWTGEKLPNGAFLYAAPVQPASKPINERCRAERTRED